MKVLYLDWPAYGQIDYPFSLEHELGFEIAYFMHDDYFKLESDEFIMMFRRYAEELHCDFAFSINYFPLMAEAAHQCNIPYICIVYDAPQYFLYHKSVRYSTNHIYLFDSCEVYKLNSRGINNVRYSILPVNSTVIDTMLEQKYDVERTTCEVSFVGQLYDGKDAKFDKMYSKLDDYSRGYVSALMNAQMKVYGADIVTPSISDKLLANMLQADRYVGVRDADISDRDVYADNYICRGITSRERKEYLEAIAAKHQVKLFTMDPSYVIPGVMNMGQTSYYDEMPYIFHNSKINLNITLRSIKSGIPLRAMDIIGAGGFLLTNYQSDFLNHFYPDEEYVYFSDREDMLAKVDYYLEREDKRIAIAKAGHDRAKAEYNFKKILGNIISESL